ncbi:MAG: hypothetical protein E6230_07270 [Paenibacillus dendritiformis]|uniref:hypothetical protein n=1 Tax=uncultured Paenibacillus sp. TaxID=227322 RepID=UPI0025D09DB3|nr:hypothetical protein [uncultured Paenibacillus sp.]MDU5141965.1 hypothetical protein [Paenibacillus dendritiformis]
MWLEKDGFFGKHKNLKFADNEDQRPVFCRSLSLLFHMVRIGLIIKYAYVQMRYQQSRVLFLALIRVHITNNRSPFQAGRIHLHTWQHPQGSTASINIFYKKEVMAHDPIPKSE